MKGLLWAMVLLLALGLPAACKATATPEEPSPSTPNVSPTPGEPRPPTPQRKGVIVIYHPAYLTVYSEEAAAAPGRIEAILKELQGVPGFVFTEPEPARVEDIRRVHTQELIESVQSKGVELYETARLAAGGAVLASEVAMAGEVSFGLIRPPGHHASPDHYWGFCYFNNIAVAIAKLLDEKRIQRALIVDFDLHLGDGTVNIFKDDPRVTYFHPGEARRIQQLESLPGSEELLEASYPPEKERIPQLQTLEDYLKRTTGYDILAVSAGFDGGKEDWGGIFETQDYTTMGTLLKKAAERNAGGRRFAVLEGGYNHQVLGKNVKAFLDGFE